MADASQSVHNVGMARWSPKGSLASWAQEDQQELAMLPKIRNNGKLALAPRKYKTQKHKLQVASHIAPLQEMFCFIGASTVLDMYNDQRFKFCTFFSFPFF